MYKNIFPLPPLARLNAERGLTLTEAQYNILKMVYDDYMTHRDLTLFDGLHKKYGLYRAAECYAELMLDRALQFVKYSTK